MVGNGDSNIEVKEEFNYWLELESHQAEGSMQISDRRRWIDFLEKNGKGRRHRMVQLH